MARPKFKGILDLGNPDTNRRCRNWIAARKGLYRVGLEPAGDTRTNQQLSYWWPCVVGPFYERLRENEAPRHQLRGGRARPVAGEAADGPGRDRPADGRGYGVAHAADGGANGGGVRGLHGAGAGLPAR
jgi:hypothetical protein